MEAEQKYEVEVKKFQEEVEDLGPEYAGAFTNLTEEQRKTGVRKKYQGEALRKFIDACTGKASQGKKVSFKTWKDNVLSESFDLTPDRNRIEEYVGALGRDLEFRDEFTRQLVVLTELNGNERVVVSIGSDESWPALPVADAASRLQKRPTKPRFSAHIPWLSRSYEESKIKSCAETIVTAARTQSKRANDFNYVLITGQSGSGKTALGENIETYLSLPKVVVLHVPIQVHTCSRLQLSSPRNRSGGKPIRVEKDIELALKAFSACIAASYFLNSCASNDIENLAALAPESTNLQAVAEAIRKHHGVPDTCTLLLAVQLDEFQKSMYPTLCILRGLEAFIRENGFNSHICVLPLLTGTNLSDPSQAEATDYHPIPIKLNGLSDQDTSRLIDNMARFLSSSLSSSSPFTPPSEKFKDSAWLYKSLIRMLGGLPVFAYYLIEQLYAADTLDSALPSVEAANKLFEKLLERVMLLYTPDKWQKALRGQDAGRMLMLVVLVRRPMAFEDKIGDCSLADLYDQGLVNIEHSHDTKFFVNVPPVLLRIIHHSLNLGVIPNYLHAFFYDLDEDSFPIFIANIHLLTYRLLGTFATSATLHEIYHGYLESAPSLQSRTVTISSDPQIVLAPEYVRNDDDTGNTRYMIGKDEAAKKAVIVKTIASVMQVDVTQGKYMVISGRRLSAADCLYPHSWEQYKFSSLVASNILDDSKKVIELALVKKEQKKSGKPLVIVSVKPLAQDVIPTSYDESVGFLCGQALRDFISPFAPPEAFAPKTKEPAEKKNCVTDVRPLLSFFSIMNHMPLGAFKVR